MTRYVLDASCLLALINEEAGNDAVQKALSGSVMSAVNVSEVVTVNDARRDTADTEQAQIESA